MTSNQILVALIEEVERLAFQMRAPNVYTPQFIQLAVEARAALAATKGDA